MASEVHRILSTVARALHDWNNEVVFIGGFVIELYKEKQLDIPPRVTNDVDCIIHIINRGKFYAFQEAIRSLGFKEDSSFGAPICRWKYDDITVDIMPTDADILGFSNPWYPMGMAYKQAYALDDGTVIYILPIAIYVATKLIALRNREGGVDFRYNKDLEDIIYLICIRNNFSDDLNTKDPELLQFMKQEFGWLLSDHLYIREAVQVLLPPVFGNSYVDVVLKEFKKVKEN
jgi:predicted nucleotidyltransferase